MGMCYVWRDFDGWVEKLFGWGNWIDIRVERRDFRYVEEFVCVMYCLLRE